MLIPGKGAESVYMWSKQNGVFTLNGVTYTEEERAAFISRKGGKHITLIAEFNDEDEAARKAAYDAEVDAWRNRRYQRQEEPVAAAEQVIEPPIEEDKYDWQEARRKLLQNPRYNRPDNFDMSIGSESDQW